MGAVAAHAGVRAPAVACGGATVLRGAPILQLGPLRVAGFSSDRCAGIALGCRPAEIVPFVKNYDVAALASPNKQILGVGLPPAAEAKMPAELSGGMKKRVGLARALVLDPEVMLYDEPTTGLDPIMSDVINELILQTKRRRPVTSVIVSHDMKTVLKVADRIVMFFPLSRLKPDEPQVLFDGTPAELRNAADPRVKQFIEGEARDRLAELQE